jgi:hypothetical protein
VCITYQPTLVNLSFHTHQICSSANMSVSDTWNIFTRRPQNPTVPDIVRFTVVLGIHNLNSIQDMRQLARHLSRIVRHPQYLGDMNDIALLRLIQPVSYSVVIRPICLPPAAGKTTTSLYTDSSIINIHLTPALINARCQAHQLCDSQ